VKYPILTAYDNFHTTPIARWSFDAAGNIVSDRANLRPVTLIDSVSRAVEPSQNGPPESLLLTGGYVTFPLTPLLDFGTEDFSICAWIRTGDAGIAHIIDKRVENSGPLQGWSLFIYQGKLNLQIADRKTWLNCAIDRYKEIAPFPIISDNRWHHVAVTVDRDLLGGGRWYVDGKEVGWRFRPRNHSGSLSNDIPLTLGRRSDSFGGIFQGNIADVRLYKQVISAAEIQSIYRSLHLPASNQNLGEIPNELEQIQRDRASFWGSGDSDREKYLQAIEYYQRSLDNHQNTGNRYGEASSLNNLGNIYNLLGEYSPAINYYKQSLKIQQEIGNRSGEAESLNALGSIYDSMGEYLQAIDCHQQCLNIHQKISHLGGIATSWRDLGSAYHSLGQYQQAIECQLQSLYIARKIHSHHRQLNSLNALGRTCVSLGKNQRAIEYCQESLNLAPQINSRSGEANALVITANAWSNLGNYLRAIELYQQALDIQQEIGDRSGQATSWRNLGNAYRCLGKYQRAIECSHESLEIARAIGEKASEGATLNNLGLAFFDSGNFVEAETTLRNAIVIWESLRGKLSDRDNFKVSIFETQAATYRHLEKVLITQEKIEAALEIAERGRARAFVELLGARLSANSQGIPDINPPNIDRIQEIAKAQNATCVEYSISFLEELFIWVIQPTGAIEFRQVDLNYEHVPLKELVVDSRESIGIRQRDCNAALKIDAGDLVKLNDDAPHWEPWQVISVDETSGILALWQSSFPKGLTIPRPVIDVREKVRSNRSNYPRFQKLYQLLIEPIADLLPKDPEAKIVFIPQGELFFVPFPALQDAAGQYLIEKYNILTAPAMQILELTSQKRQSDFRSDSAVETASRQTKDSAVKTASRQTKSAFADLRIKDVLNPDLVLIVGNPTMPEVSLAPGKPAQQLSALPHSETEANTIAQLFCTQALTGNAATKAAVIERLSNARIVHFATHGLLDRTYGLGSAIALAPDENDSGLLTAEEILDLNLKTDLVVLSACNTGMGRITGDGVIGLSRALISAGASSAIVSLWAVPDAPTADLMVKFYQKLDRGGNKAQALRYAMLETMQQHPNPRDWAAFTLIGET
jgi:CHAT domain-containing protein/tetratricopeptide (TPR) repeat protein